MRELVAMASTGQIGFEAIASVEPPSTDVGMNKVGYHAVEDKGIMSGNEESELLTPLALEERVSGCVCVCCQWRIQGGV